MRRRRTGCTSTALLVACAVALSARGLLAGAASPPIVPPSADVSMDASSARGVYSRPSLLGGTSLVFSPSSGLLDTLPGPNQDSSDDTAWDPRKGAFHTVELGGASGRKIPLGAGIRILDTAEAGCSPGSLAAAFCIRIFLWCTVLRVRVLRVS